jgi:hypothetical protein
MGNQTGVGKRAWILLGCIIALILLILWFAPEERTLGQGIKIVYVHVGVTWTALLGFTLLGIMGVLVLLSANEKLFSWIETISQVSLWIYVASVIIGVLASKVNWGAVAWTEPRMLASFNLLAAAVIVQMLKIWLPSPRLGGILHVGLMIFMVWTIFSSALVLHPGDAIRTTESFGIRFAFFSLFFLILSAGTWFVWYLRRQKNG